MAIEIPEVPIPPQTEPYTYEADAISPGRLLARRLTRPQTYFRAAQQLLDTYRWGEAVDGTIERAIAEQDGDFNIVQIGANDGNRNDPVQRYARRPGIRSLLVEPVPEYYDQLRQNYRDVAGATFAPVAIDSSVGSTQMWAVDPHSRLRGSSTMHREVLDKAAWITGDKDINRITHPIEVRTLTVPRLLTDYGFPSVDWLVVDTEGHDKVVLDQVTPELVTETGLRCVLWERMHLPKSEQRELKERFQDMGFSTTDFRRDTFASRQ